jgi:predicted acetyltransferase
MAKQVTLKKGTTVINVDAGRQKFYESLGYKVVGNTVPKVKESAEKDKKAAEPKNGGAQ